MTFTNAPVTRLLVLGLVSASIGASMLDVKHYFYISIDTHLWKYRQFWRLLAYQLCYANSTEVLFAAMSFFFNYMPAGPTPIVFAILAQYHAIVPHVYKYRVATSPGSQANDSAGITLSDKSYQYAIAFHLSLLQWPGSVLGAFVGWAVGNAWRGGFMPLSLVTWRLPGWMVGLSSHRRTAEFEGLRRRLEGENTSATGVTSGMESEGQQTERRRTMGQKIVDQFREAL
ncbi:hypothetical protein UVI_02000930 [Ustilaginoidea virens]|uniref:UBA domain-containing protein Ucp14 n=1 Tax=Ustilaginoidea virens TaxID=1159556 RepID=A0A1B5KTK5_USTVR|nr:hypothetical protein UVI_02000930 [Ustilaginoidea virens]